VLVFFDDILIYKKSRKDHVQHVDRVLKLLEEKQLYEKISKCFFGVDEVEYLGHIVPHEGVKVDPNKIKANKEWKILTTIKHLRGLFGLTRYYHKFVNNYGRIAAPLTTLLDADALLINDEDVEAFLCVISIIQPDWITKARDEWKNYEEMWKLVQKLQQDPSTYDTFS